MLLTVGQGAVDAREMEPVCFFWVVMDLMTPAYVPLDATSDQSITTSSRGGPSDGAHYFLFTSIDQHQEQSGYATLRFLITYPVWLLCFRSGIHDDTQ